MKIETLHDLFVHELRDIYYAEKQLVKALPKMEKMATNAKLKKAIGDHHKETIGHVDRLEQIFQLVEVAARGIKCEAMDGLLAEANETLAEIEDTDVRDAAIIASAQRVEHYEIAAYGTARAFARRLGLNDAADLLTATIDEEGAADKALTKIAESSVNSAAIA